MGKAPRSPARQSNRDVLAVLMSQMTATHKINRELLNHLRTVSPVMQQILELLALMRQDMTLAKKSAMSSTKIECPHCGHDL